MITNLEILTGVTTAGWFCSSVALEQHKATCQTVILSSSLFFVVL
jgi:hypothetical protein